MTRLLAIETSTLAQSLALSVDGEVVESVARRQKGGHSRSLATTAVELLARHGLDVHGLDAFVVDVGPGSFTGLRVGLSLVKGIAAVTGTGVIPIRSVDAMGAEHAPGRSAAVAFDAHNDRVYGALVAAPYRGDDAVPLAAWSPAEFARRVAETAPDAVLCGDGWVRYSREVGDLVDVSASVGDAPSAPGMLLALEHSAVRPVLAAGVEPLYVRKSAAEERLERR